MAPPPNSLGAHQRDIVAGAAVQQALYRRLEVSCLHVVGITLERPVLPNSISRIGSRTPAPAKVRKMTVTDSGCGKLATQFVLIELRVIARIREPAHVSYQIDA